MNEVFMITEILIMYILLYMINLLFKKDGLILFVLLAGIGLLIGSDNFISILGFPVCGGTVFWGTAIVALNNLTQRFGKDYLDKVIKCGLLLSIFVFIICFIVVNLGTDSSIVNGIYFDNIFNIPLRNLIAFLITFVIGVRFNNLIYYNIRTKKNKIWVSNLVTVIISSFINVVIFCVIAYFGKVDNLELIMMIIMSAIIMIITGISGTWFIYKENKI